MSEDECSGEAGIRRKEKKRERENLWEELLEEFAKGRVVDGFHKILPAVSHVMLVEIPLGYAWPLTLLIAGLEPFGSKKKNKQLIVRRGGGEAVLN